MAEEARAVEVLREIEERGSDRVKEKAKKILQIIRGRGEEGEDGDWEGVLESGGLSQTRCRVGGGGGGRNGYCSNSFNF